MTLLCVLHVSEWCVCTGKTLTFSRFFKLCAQTPTYRDSCERHQSALIIVNNRKWCMGLRDKRHVRSLTSSVPHFALLPAVCFNCRSLGDLELKRDGTMW